MGVHHSKQHLDVFVLLVTGSLLVLVQLCDLFVAHLQQDLFGLLGFQHLGDSAPVHGVHLEGVSL